MSCGVTELESGDAPLGRVRRSGGGRKRAVDLDPGLRPALLALVEPDVRGDPMLPLRWTTKSTRQLAAELTRQGHRVSADTVAAVLREEGSSLQGNAKTIEGAQHPDRDAQFHYINDQAKNFQAAGGPVIRLHHARHGCATPLTAAGVAPRVIREILGHTQISITTDVYTHVVHDAQREAISHMDRLLKRRPPGKLLASRRLLGGGDAHRSGAAAAAGAGAGHKLRESS